jgi:hypothetical protein
LACCLWELRKVNEGCVGGPDNAVAGQFDGNSLGGGHFLEVGAVDV